MSFLRAGRTGVRFLHNIPSARVRAQGYLNHATPLCLHGGDGVTASASRLPPSTILSIIRTFADRPASRPKQHTGKAPARKSPAKKSSSTGTKSKPGPKPKAKPKKKVVDPEKVQRQKELAKAKKAKDKSKDAVKQLKAASLKDKEPPSSPVNAYLYYYKESIRNKTISAPISDGKLGGAAKEVGARYLSLSPEDREALNHRTNMHNEAVAEAYRKWVESHTPAQIREANKARAALTRQGVRGFKSVKPIKDPRQPKAVPGAYPSFMRDRMASGDFKGIKSVEAVKLIAREWHELPANEKERRREAYREAKRQREREISSE